MALGLTNKSLKASSKIPVIPGVKRSLSRRNDPDADKVAEEFDRQRLAIIKRDNWTCRGEGCGFSSRRMEHWPSGGMDVHHADDNHANNDPGNLVTLCPFCNMTFSLGRRGTGFAATLGLLPGISQGDLNLIFHVVWGMSRAIEIIDDDHDLPEKHRRTQWLSDDIPEEGRSAILDARSELNRMIVTSQSNLHSELDDVLPNIGDIETLYSVLMELTEDEYRERHRILEHIRLFPRLEAFEELIDTWAREVWLRQDPPSSWPRLINDVQRRLNGKGKATLTGAKRVR